MDSRIFPKTQIKRIMPEIVDGCQLKCALCWNRNRKGTFKQMSLSIIKKVIDRFGKDDLYYSWYNWGEPLLYNQFYDFVEIVKNVKSSISSNFSMELTDRHFTSLSKLWMVIASISGLTKEVYNIYHVGGNFGLVINNIKQLVGFPQVQINWIKHPNNVHQEEEMKEFCEKNGFIYRGIYANCEVEELIEGFSHPFLKMSEHYLSRNRENCYLKNWIPISVDGEFLLCNTTHNVGTGFTIWDNITVEELVEVKSNHKLCMECNKNEFWRMF